MSTTHPTSTGTTPARDWRSHAACLGVDPELFFPVADAGPVRDAQVAEAKAVCAGCPVVAACLAEALARIPDGIAGGLTESERRTLRRRDRHQVTAVVRAVSGAQRIDTDRTGGRAA